MSNGLPEKSALAIEISWYSHFGTPANESAAEKEKNKIRIVESFFMTHPTGHGQSHRFTT